MRCNLGPEDGRAEEWKCAYCSATNYHWRTQCYKCLVPRSTSRAQQPGNEASPNDDGTTEAAASPPLKVDQAPAAPLVFDSSHDVCPSPSRFLLLQFLKRDARPEQARPHCLRIIHRD